MTSIFDGIVSFPFGHLFLFEIRNYKKEAEEKTQKLILEKIEMLRLQAKAISSIERFAYFQIDIPSTFCLLYH